MEQHAQERVDIAKDVLEWLASDTLIASEESFNEVGHSFLGSRGGYLSVRIPYGAEAKSADEVGDARDFLKSQPQCRVCAKGALLYGAIMKFDGVALKDLIDSDDYLQIASHNSSFEWLSQWFDPEQLQLMEAVYEGDIEVEYREKYPGASSFLDAYEVRGKEGLRKIMKNIIENGGTFCP